MKATKPKFIFMGGAIASGKATLANGIDCDHQLYFLSTPLEVCAERFKKRNENPNLAISEESLNEAAKAGVKNDYIPPTAEENFTVIEVTPD